MRTKEAIRENAINNTDAFIEETYNLGYEDGLNKGRVEGYETTTIWQDGYHKGLDEAWECAKRLIYPPIDGGMTYDVMEKVFDFHVIDTYEVFKTNSAYEAIEKIRAYESKLNEPDKEYEIQIGDEVTNMRGDKGYVTGIEGDEFCVLYPDGTVGISTKSTCAFTGKNNTLIKDFLKQMKGAADEQSNIKS